MGLMSFFRQRSEPSQTAKVFSLLMRRPPANIVETVRGLICSLNQNGVIMTLVAYKNVERLRNPDWERVPDTIDLFVDFLCSDHDKLGTSPRHEITRRRILWFIHALMIKKVNELAEHDDRFVKSAADIWVHIIVSSGVLKIALKHNILWTEDEKDWWGTFWDEDDRKTKKHAVSWCMSFAMPRWLRNNPDLMQDLAHFCIANLPTPETIAYYMRQARMCYEHSHLDDGIKTAARQYQEVADDIRSGASQIRHPEALWEDFMSPTSALGRLYE
jgi:hypothetical protein